MAITTEILITTTDGQGYEETWSLFVTPATFGATTLPTSAHIIDIANAAFNDTAPYVSTNKVKTFGVRVTETDAVGAGAIGGTGAVGTNIAAKMRSGIGVVGPIGRNGVAEGIEARIPGLDKSQILLNPQDLNQISGLTADPWATLRAALVVAGYRPAGGLAFTSDQIFQSGVVFTGTRAPLRPR